MHNAATSWKFDPDASYDLYGLDEDGERHAQPFYRIRERRFYNTTDRLPNGDYRGRAGSVVLCNGPENPVVAGEKLELTKLGVIKDGLFIRGDSQRYVLVEIPAP